MALPPLLPEGGELTGPERTRYARHLLLPGFGASAQRRLRAARVLVVGAGGLGSPALLYLAAAGVGRIGVVDDDAVELTNLQRQVIHTVDEVGRPKTGSAARAVAALNPDVEVVEHRARLGAGNALDVLADYDLVLDGADSFATRYLVGDACVRLGMPHVWGSVYRYDGQASVWFAGEGPCYRCVFPAEPPAGSVPSCSTGGVLGTTCGVIGSVMAGEAVKLVTGVGEPLVGRLLLHDALRQEWGSLPVSADPGCPVCGSEADPARPLAAASSGAREPGAPGPDPEQLWGAVSVQGLSRRLADRTAGRDDFVLVDVRESGEREVVTIPGAVSVPLSVLRSGTESLPSGSLVLVHCKTGVRSSEAVRLLRERGVDARAVEGGVLAWVSEIDPDLPTY